MRHAGNTAQLLFSVAFIVSGLLTVLLAPATSPHSPRAGSEFVGPVLSEPVITDAAGLARLYLPPQNLIMWGSVLALWGGLLIDALGTKPGRNGRRIEGDIALPLNVTLLSGAIWPWLIGRLDLLAGLLAVVMMLSALTAARRSASLRRPAIGFLAGWTTGLTMTVLAALVAGWLRLDLGTMVAIAMVTTAVIGAYVQSITRIPVSYSVALIWAFCGVAASTMGNSPVIALAAIVGTAALAIALIRAAT